MSKIPRMRGNGPVVYMFPKSVQGMGWLATEPGATVHTPEEIYTVEIGKAKVVREGSDVIIFNLGMGLHNALKAAAQLEADGVSVGALVYVFGNPAISVSADMTA